MPNLTDGEVQDLKTELVNDPDSLGYTDADGLKSNADLQAILNERRAAYEVARSSIPMSEFYGVVDWTGEAVGFTTTQLLQFMVVTSTPNIDGSSASMRSAIEVLFGSGSNTLAAFDDLRLRNASRAEDLFGEGASVGLEDLRAAKDL